MTDPSDILLVDVRKRFGTHEALRGLDLEVRPREFVAILGPTGCGKTTALRVIAGFEQPDSGSVLLAGQPVAALPPNQRPTSTVFQHYALFPNMSVFDNVAYGLRVRRVARDEIERRVQEALTLVRLAGYGPKRIQGLSGGEQQRVALARAIVTRPRMLLLDEPLSSIDQALRTAMQVELRQLQTELGITFLLVTHDQQEALSLADRLIVMRQGRVVQNGPGDEVYRRPHSRFVAGFLGEANLFDVSDLAPLNGDTTGADADGSVVIAGAHHERRTVTLCVRPEAIVVGPAAAGLPNRRQATLEDDVFRGQVRTLVLRTRTGRRIIATTLTTDGFSAQHGDDVEVGWRPTAAAVLEDDE
ncbi:MAG: ABC transporter ATP-binding protein [Thermomicrobiales bacterium]|nr:ABC transporter ATP-binding protein [Thermomicrobiales bacterium]